MKWDETPEVLDILREAEDKGWFVLRIRRQMEIAVAADRRLLATQIRTLVMPSFYEDWGGESGRIAWVECRKTILALLEPGEAS